MSIWANWPQIEGFDEETAAGTAEPRASNSSKPATRKCDDKRLALGVDRRCGWKSKALPPPWRWRWARTSIKTLEDLAGCATDDLIGYYEVNKDKERVRVPGALDGFDLTTDDANAIIMKARVKIGWIERRPVEEGSR